MGHHLLVWLLSLLLELGVLVKRRVIALPLGRAFVMAVLSTLRQPHNAVSPALRRGIIL